MIALTLSLGRILITLVTGEIKGLLHNKKMIFLPSLRHNFFCHVAVDIGQAKVATGIAVGELLMIKPQ